MANDINNRLERIRKRRSGTDRLYLLAEDARREILAKSIVEESWEKRAAKTKPYTRYALAAMQEVSPDYTRISIETAERVGRQLDTKLTTAGFSVEFRLQGSVPLNVHIRGVSDVDLLNIDTSFLTYSVNGQRSRGGLYTSSVKNSIGVLSDLRRESEKILKIAFPVAKVDISGGKAITLSGASLARPVDVVPAHWHDTIDYQASGQEHDRGVTILNKKVPESIKNLPFLHIKHIDDQCKATLGGLRKAIRLCKNVKADNEEEGVAIALPSFDICATMYHANPIGLIGGYANELAILAETQRHLDHLACNHEHAKTLKVPDSSRTIFDTPSKLEGLNRLSREMDNLLRDVAKEQNLLLAVHATPPLADCRVAISSGYVS